MSERNNSDTTQQINRISEKLAKRADGALDQGEANANGVHWNTEQGIVLIDKTQSNGGYDMTNRDTGIGYGGLTAKSFRPESGGVSVKVGDALESDKIARYDQFDKTIDRREPTSVETTRKIAAHVLGNLKKGIAEETARQQEARKNKKDQESDIYGDFLGDKKAA